MKRHLLILPFLFLAVTAYSQTNHHYKFTWGLSVNDYSLYGYGAKLGYRFGPGIEFRKEDSWLSYGFDLLMTTKGTSGHEGSMEQKYIQLPANLNLHWQLSDRLDLQWTNSLYFAYGFAGKSKSKIDNNIGWTASTFSDDNLWGKGLPRFDLGFTTGAALDFGRCVLGVNFELGLIPLDSETYYNEYDEEEIEAALNISMFVSFAIKF